MTKKKRRKLLESREVQDQILTAMQAGFTLAVLIREASLIMDMVDDDNDRVADRIAGYLRICASLSTEDMEKGAQDLADTPYPLLTPDHQKSWKKTRDVVEMVSTLVFSGEEGAAS